MRMHHVLIGFCSVWFERLDAVTTMIAQQLPFQNDLEPAQIDVFEFYSVGGDPDFTSFQIAFDLLELI